MSSRVAIYGGTFDPIHTGHLLAAQEALERCALSKVVFLPSGDPPHKSRPDMAPASDRAEMVVRGIAGDPRFELSRSEIERSGKSYTVETLELLHREWGTGVELFLLIGIDSAIEMPTWTSPERVVDLARVAVLARPGFDRARVRSDLARRMIFLDSPAFEVSSTDIRNRIREGRSVLYLVPDAVMAYISETRLYGSDGLGGNA